MSVVNNMEQIQHECSEKQTVKPNDCSGESLSDISILESAPESNSKEEPHSMVEEVTETNICSQEAILSKDFVQLCKKLAAMVKEYDLMAKQMPDGEAKDLLTDMSEQIISSMVAGGCKAITKETTFDGHRHKTVPFSSVEDGTPILSTERVGVECNGMVLIQALVKT